MYNNMCNKYILIITIKTQKWQNLTVYIALLVVLKKRRSFKVKQKLSKTRLPVSVSIPFNEFLKIDETANSLNLTRSNFILQAVRKEIKNLQEQNQEKIEENEENAKN